MVAVALLGTAISWGVANIEPTPPSTTFARADMSVSTPSLSARDALVMCRFAVAEVSRDPEKAVIPYVPEMGGRPGEFVFVWNGNTRHMRMRNGIGLEVAVSGLCSVNAQTRRITQLLLDGKRFL